MSYAALPDRRLSFDNDGTVVVTSAANQPYTTGATTYPTQAQVIAANGTAILTPSNYTPWGANISVGHGTWFFFPEQRAITGLCIPINPALGYPPSSFTYSIDGSNDTTNGLDGTWEVATLPDGTPFPHASQIDVWRTTIRSVSFTGPKRVLRVRTTGTGGIGTTPYQFGLFHIYGEKAAGETPHDLVFIDHDTTPGVEYQTDEDFGDRPLGTTVVRQFRVKNVSPTLTANSINIQCNDSDFAISTDGVTWVVTINIASLAAGAESATLYMRNTTPAPGNPLGPRFARIVAIVGSWT